MESDILRLVQAYLDAGGTAKMTCGGLRRIAELDTDAARCVGISRSNRFSTRHTCTNCLPPCR